MRTKLVRIGNSRGVRLPKPILAASGISDEVDLKVEDGCIVLTRPKRHPREGWAEDARRMVANGDDEDWSDRDNMSSEALEEDWDWPEDFKWPEGEIVFTSTSPSSIQFEAQKSPKPDRARSSPRRK